MSLASIILALAPSPVAPADGGERPEARAVAYLAAEVPRWRAENGCASCHHNGDGAHALYRAIGLGMPVPGSAVADSTAWLRDSDSWDDNGGDGPFSDKRLARIQFARALSAAVEEGILADRAPLDRAAERLAADQQADGSWAPDGPDALGSPATFGRPLASLVAQDVLLAADPDRYRSRIEAADAWLRARPIRTVLDASVELLRREGRTDAEAARRRDLAIDLLRRSQSEDGGWGPYEVSPPEAFDTAVAVLALTTHDSEEASRSARRGRSFLIAAQLSSGGWVETTRPAGNESYAQQTSTTAWATLALLATRHLAEEGPAAPGAGDQPRGENRAR